jgi:hypothetical protein
MSDLELVRVMVGEERAIVTNDAEDFELIHEQVLAAGMEHHGLVLTSDATMPRTRQAIPQWIEALGVLLDEHRAADALRNQIHHLLRIQ